jgi:hypothetical protein
MITCRSGQLLDGHWRRAQMERAEPVMSAPPAVTITESLSVNGHGDVHAHDGLLSTVKPLAEIRLLG